MWRPSLQEPILKRPVLNGTSDPPAPVHLSPTKQLHTHRTYCYSVYQHRPARPIKTDITLNGRNTGLYPSPQPLTLSVGSPTKPGFAWALGRKPLKCTFPCFNRMIRCPILLHGTHSAWSKVRTTKNKMERDPIWAENTLGEAWATKPKTKRKNEQETALKRRYFRGCTGGGEGAGDGAFD